MTPLHPDRGYPGVKPGPEQPGYQRRPASVYLLPALIRSSKAGKGCVPLSAGAPNPEPLPSLSPRLVRARGADGGSSRAEPGAPLHSHSGEGNRGNGGGGAAARKRGRGKRETRSHPLSPRVRPASPSPSDLSGPTSRLASHDLHLRPTWCPRQVADSSRLSFLDALGPGPRPADGSPEKTAKAGGRPGASLRPQCPR